MELGKSSPSMAPILGIGPAEGVLSKPPRGAPPVEARIYLTRSGIVSLVILSWITADRPLAAAVATLAETGLAVGLRPTR